MAAHPCDLRSVHAGASSLVPDLRTVPGVYPRLARPAVQGAGLAEAGRVRLHGPGPSAVNCARCEAETDGQLFLCSRCVHRLSKILLELVHHAVDLEQVVATRLTSHRGERIMVRGSREFPLPFDVAAAEAVWELRSDLAAAVKDAVAQGGVYDDELDSESMAWWLSGHVRLLAAAPDAEETYDVLEHRYEETVRVVNIPAERVLLGPCDHDECGADVRAVRAATAVICGSCLTLHDVEDFKERVRLRMRGGCATFEELQVLFRGQVRENLLRVWRKRGRLPVAGTAGGEILYQIGPIMDLVAGSKPR